MPVPSLPEELVVIIFKLLYRSLCVDPRCDRLDLPDVHHRVFTRIAAVSRTWRRLARPFLYRHLNTGTTVPLDAGYVRRSVESGMVRSLKHHGGAFEVTDSHFESLAATLERLEMDIKDTFEMRRLIPSQLANLRDLSLIVTTRLDLTAIEDLVGPALESLQVIFLASQRNVVGAPYLEPNSVFGNLKRVHLRCVCGPEHFQEFVAPALLCSRSLVNIDIQLDDEEEEGFLEFDDLFPRTLPLVKSFCCTGDAIDCNSSRLFSTFPSLVHLELDALFDVPALDAAPDSLQSLVFDKIHPFHFPALVDALVADEEAGYLAHLRTCRVVLADASADASVLAALAPHKARLVQAFADSTVHLIAPFLADFLPDEAFASLPRPPRAADSSTSAYLPLYPLSADPHPDTDYVLPDGVPPSSREWPPSSSESEGESDYADNAKWDWDAEDGELFRGRWSEEKKIERDLDTASSAALAPVLSRFKTAAERDTAAEVVRDALRPLFAAGSEAAGAGDQPAGQSAEAENETEREVTMEEA
ncbi:hypothetical protein JCM10207_005864 [Rhodosporidiobolus poonsookiae]